MAVTNTFKISSVRTELWYVWAEIAVAAARDARVERERYAGRRLAGADTELTMEREIKAALVAITASSHSLDAFYTHVSELGLVPTDLQAIWKENRTPWHARVLPTLTATFSIGKKAKGWATGFKALAALRNGAVHYRATPGPLVPHPVGHLATPIAALYTAEAASKSVSLVLDVITTCIASPRSSAAARAWSRSWAHAASDFRGPLEELSS